MTTKPNDLIDWNSLIAAIIYTAGICVSFIVGVNKYFKDKKEAREAFVKTQELEKKKFIEEIAKTAATTVMDGVLKDVRDDISLLFKYREEDRNYLNGRFDTIISKLNK